MSRRGQCVVRRQDDLGECMYLLVHGRASVVHHKEGRQIELATLGNRAISSGKSRSSITGRGSADVVAMEDCQLMQITQASISGAGGGVSGRWRSGSF